MDNELNIGQVLWWAVNKLKNNQIESAQIDAELLLCRVLGISREKLYIDFEKEIDENCYFLFEKLVAQRLMRVPVAYLLNEKYFFGLNFFVDENVLIPRPETEELVILTLEQIEKMNTKKEKINLLEIGTGSGAIIVSLAKCLQKAPWKNKINFFASDKSKTALDVAKLNIGKHNLQKEISLFYSDLLCDVPDEIQLDIIVANLPYLDRERIDEYSPEIKYEPQLALFAEEKGKKIYFDLFSQIKERGQRPIVIAECSYDQVEDLKKGYKNIKLVGV